jgi:hypothetical protein
MLLKSLLDSCYDDVCQVHYAKFGYYDYLFMC